ncbi:unnamed protein product [Ixodes persulcatus]
MLHITWQTHLGQWLEVGLFCSNIGYHVQHPPPHLQFNSYFRCLTESFPQQCTKEYTCIN